VQAQVLDLLRDLKARMALSLIFITHDLRVAAQICDRIAVMQRGRIVEIGETAEVFAAPQHPYTRELLAAVPGSGGPARDATRRHVDANPDRVARASDPVELKGQ
jgi:peptide/nickel transport system ATP-binding protein